MTAQTQQMRGGGSYGGRWLSPERRQRAGMVLALALAAGMLWACRNQEMTTTDEITLPPVGPVTAYGMVLGADAKPEQVAYVLTQAIRDYVKVSQGHDREARKQDLELQVQLAAPNRIWQISQGLYTSFHPDAKVADLTQKDRDDWICKKMVKLWSPIAARYVDSFNAPAEPMMAAMRVVYFDAGGTRVAATAPGARDARVSYDVTDPFEPNRGKVTFQVFLTREPGGDGKQTFWRVYRLGYAPIGNDDAIIATTAQAEPASATTRAAAPAPATQPSR